MCGSRRRRVRNSRRLLFAAVGVLGAAGGGAQPLPQSLPIDQLVVWLRPVGGLTLAGAEVSLGAEVAAQWRHPAFPYLSAAGTLGYRLLPLGSAPALEVWTGSVGAGVMLDIAPLTASASAGFGAVWWEQASAAGEWDWDIAWRGGLGVGWRIAPWLGAQLSLEYQYMGAVYEGIVATIGIGVYPAPLLRPARLALIRLGEETAAPAVVAEPNESASTDVAATQGGDESAAASTDGTGQPEAPTAGPQPLRLLATHLDPLFSAIYRSYLARPAGRLVIDNPNEEAVENLRALATLSGAPAQQQRLDLPDRLEPATRLEIPVTLALPAAVGSTDGAARVDLLVQLQYSLGGEVQNQSFSVSGQLYGYESISWIDTRRTAAFVTPDQPVVARFATAARDVARGRPLATVAALWAGLHQAGVTYTRDFFTPFGDALLDTTNIDFVRYPVQTLAERWGDDLELTLLLASLLEAADVSSVLVISEGRALLAAALGADAGQLPDKLGGAVRAVAGTTWLILDPRETDSLWTATSSAEELLSGLNIDDVEIVVFREAWADYPPVAGPDINELLADADAIGNAMRSAVRDLSAAAQ